MMIKSYVCCVVLLSISLTGTTTEGAFLGNLNDLIPSFPPVDAIFAKIRNFFQPEVTTNFIRVSNDTYIWRLTLNLTGYNISSLNATREGQFFHFTGIKITNKNTTTKLSIDELLSKSVNMEQMTIRIENKTLIAEAPVQLPKVHIIPIQGKSLYFD